MRKSVQVSLPPMGLTVVDPRASQRSTTVDPNMSLVLDLLNRAVADCDYTLDALQAAMGKDRAYIHKVLQGEKPLSYAFIVALPDDVEARFESLRAESCGHIVVTPVTGDQAVRHLVSGLVGVLGRRIA